MARITGNRLGRYVEADPDKTPGEGNFLRGLHHQNTSIACGLECCLWFVGSQMMDMNTQELNEAGKDVARVNAWTRPLWGEIPRLGLPAAIFSTPVSKDLANRDVPPEGGKRRMPLGLEQHRFPANFWLQPASGEFVMGVIKYDGSQDAVYVANHNAYAEQDVKLTVSMPTHPRIFNRQAGKYEDLPVVNGAIRFKLEKGGEQLLLLP